MIQIMQLILPDFIAFNHRIDPLLLDFVSLLIFFIKIFDILSIQCNITSVPAINGIIFTHF